MDYDPEYDPLFVAQRFGVKLQTLMESGRDGIGGVVVVNGVPMFYGITVEKLSAEDAVLVLDGMRNAIMLKAFGVEVKA